MPEGKPSKREMMPRERLRQIATGFVLSRSVAVAAELKIADTLKNESKTALEIAEELKLNKDSLYRFLRFLSCNGIFSENTNEQFTIGTDGLLVEKSRHQLKDELEQNQIVRFKHNDI